jgi:hypothetical protein
MARKQVGAAPSAATHPMLYVAPGFNRNVLKSNGSAWSSSPLSAADILNEIYIDYTGKTVLPTVTDDSAAHTITDTKGVTNAAFGITGVNDVQTITMTATAGTWTLSVGGQTTISMAFNVATATVQTNVQALSTVGSGNCTVTGTAGVSYVLTFNGALASTVMPDVATNNSALTGGLSSPAHTTYGGHRFYNTDTTTAGTTAVYRTATTANSVTWMGMEFDFSATGTSAGPPSSDCATFVAWATALPMTSGVLSGGAVDDSPCHCDFFLEQFQYGIFQNGTLTVLISFNYDVAFTQNQYQYAEVAIDKYAGVASLKAPDGTVWGFSHSQVSAVTAQFACHETFSGNATSTKKPYIAKFSADSSSLRVHSTGGISRAQNLIADGRAALRNYIPTNTLRFIDGVYTNRGTKFDLAADANTAGQLSTLYVPARSGNIINKLYSQTAQTSLTNTVTETIVAQSPLGMWGNELAVGGAGVTLKFTLIGSISTLATSGALTFKVYLANAAATQTFVMPSQASALTSCPFVLEIWAQVRTTGSTGTFIAGGYGMMWPTTTTVAYIIPASGTSTATTTTLNTVTTIANAGGVKPLAVTATWATASASNILRVELATIERPT